MTGDNEAAWLTIDEAAAKRGTTVDAIRGLIRRGRLEHHKDNQGRVKVRLSPSQRLVERLGDDGQSISQRLADAEAATERWRSMAEERGHALAKAEGEATAMRLVVDELRKALDREQARADKLDAELHQLHTEARRSWWQRLFGR